MPIKIGDSAPNFKLFSSDKREISLEQYHGKKNLLLMFFPLAFTSLCTKQMGIVRDSFTDYRNVASDILAISVDTIFSLEKYRTEQNLPFALLSDFNKETSRLYGTLYTEFVFGMRDVSKTASFIIDKNGIVQYAEILESAGDLPNFEAITAKLKSLT